MARNRLVDWALVGASGSRVVAASGGGHLEQEWKRRLTAVIRSQVAQGRTLKEISQSAGLGPNFVQQLLSSSKVPSVDALLALCGSLKIAVAELFADETVEQTEQIINLAQKLRPEDLRLVLELARYLSAKASQQET